MADNVNILTKTEYGNILNWQLSGILKELTNWVKLSWFSNKY